MAPSPAQHTFFHRSWLRPCAWHCMAQPSCKKSRTTHSAFHEKYHPQGPYEIRTKIVTFEVEEIVKRENRCSKMQFAEFQDTGLGSSVQASQFETKSCKMKTIENNETRRNHETKTITHRYCAQQVQGVLKQTEKTWRNHTVKIPIYKLTLCFGRTQVQKCAKS